MTGVIGRNRRRSWVGGLHRPGLRPLRVGPVAAAGLLLVTGTAAGCARAATSTGEQTAVTVRASSTASNTATDRSVPVVWTSLDGGGRIQHPAAWRAYPLPLGLTPGTHVVLALSTSADNPCRRQARDNGTAGSCWLDRLGKSGVEITWTTLLPTPTSQLRTPSRTWTDASSRCARIGGVRTLSAVLPSPDGDSGHPGYAVGACLADPGSADRQRQVEAMLDSLHS